jgi:cysteine-S-conjugate beta-lyase
MNSGFEFLSLGELREKKSYKWRQYGGNTIPLTVAEMDFRVAPAITSALQDMVNRSDMGYLGANPEIQEAFAKFANLLWGWQISSNLVRVGNDVGSCVQEILTVITQPMEAVLINSPVTNFAKWILESGRSIHDIPLIEKNMNYTLDLPAIEKAFEAGVRTYLLCNPHSPVGITYSKRDLSVIAKLAKKYGVTVLSDEIHGALMFDAQDFTPFLNSCPEAGDVGICISSASKTFNISGLKCAIYLSQSSEINEELDRIPESARHRASLFGVVATTAAFESGLPWLLDTIDVLEFNAQHLISQLAMNLPQTEYRKPDFGYLAWLNFGDFNWLEEFAKADVALLSGEIYDTNIPNFARLNFATDPAIMRLVFDRLSI